MKVILYICCCCFLLFRIDIINANTTFAVNYLQRYGFMGKQDDNSLVDNDIFITSLSMFQEYYKLPATGELNSETLELMKKPRCGVSDLLAYYSVKPVIWQHKNITWHFKMANTEVHNLTKTAFEQWSKNSGLTFSHSRNKPNILLSFQRLLHKFEKSQTNCAFPFDGKGMILGHSYYPTSPESDIEIHIDVDEDWSYARNNSDRDKHNFYSVILHEIGHALGFEHSSNKDSIMYAFYNENLSTLNTDDIDAVQHAYGKPPPPPPPSTTTEQTHLSSTTPTSSSSSSSPTVSTESEDLNSIDLCRLNNLQHFSIINNRLYIMHERWVWFFDLTGNDDELLSPVNSKPHLITDWLQFLPKTFKRISAAYQRPNGEVVLVINNMVYLFNIKTLQLGSGYPQSVAIFGIPRNSQINAIINTNAGRTYVIFDSVNYAEIDECFFRAKSFGTMSELLPNIPSGIDSSYRHLNGNIYFFKGTKFYEFNEFSKNLLRVGKNSLELFGLNCHKNMIFDRIKDLLSHYNIAPSSK